MADAPITLHEAAERLGVHYMTAYRYVRTGRLPARKEGAEWRVEVADLDRVRPGDEAEPPRRRRGRTDYVDRLTDRLVAGDEPGAWTVVEQALTAGLAPPDVYVQLLSPALELIGDRWEAGEVTVAEEHEGSAIVLRLIGRLGPRMRRRGRTRGSILLAAPPGDQHGVPVALLGDLLRERGFRVHDLGANVPADSLAETALHAERLVAVGIGATTLDNERNIRAAIAAVRAVVAVPVVLGGSAIVDAHLAARLGGDAWAPRAPQAIEVFEAIARHDDLPAGAVAS